LAGKADVTSRMFDMTANGQTSLAVLQAFYPLLSAKGGAELKARLAGTFDKPELTGEAVIENGELRHQSMPQAVREINGPITIEAGRISVEPKQRDRQSLHAVMGGGPITFAGGIILDGYRPVEFDLQAHGASMHLRYPEGLQSTVRADLYLVGPVKSPVLGGTVDVLRASYSLRYQPQLGYFGLLTGTGDTEGGTGPVAVQEETPPPFPMQLAIKIRATSTPFVENKAASALIYGSADIDVTGTIDHPAITGRVSIDRGEYIVAGNRYHLLQIGQQSAKIDPFFELAPNPGSHPGQTYQVTVWIVGTFASFGADVHLRAWLPEFQIIVAARRNAGWATSCAPRARRRNCRPRRSVGRVCHHQPDFVHGLQRHPAHHKHHDANRADSGQRIQRSTAQPDGRIILGYRIRTRATSHVLRVRKTKLLVSSTRRPGVVGVSRRRPVVRPRLQTSSDDGARASRHRGHGGRPAVGRSGPRPGSRRTLHRHAHRRRRTARRRPAGNRAATPVAHRHQSRRSVGPGGLAPRGEEAQSGAAVRARERAD
jgi:hypothetical protein